MPRARLRPSGATVRTITAAAGDLGGKAVARLEASHAWFRALAPDERSWVGLVAQSGIVGFVEWLGQESSGVDVTADVFGTAPRELTRSISLAQTLDLLRSVVDVVEEEVVALAPEADRAIVREAVLRYSREVAFGAAQVYAHAAEVRGAWDARLESVVVDAVLRGEADQGISSRAAALGWGSIQGVAVMVGTAPPPRASAGSDDPQRVVAQLHRRARRAGLTVLATVNAGRVVAVVGGVSEVRAAADELRECFADDVVVVGPRVPHLFAAGRSARAALAGFAAAPARRGHEQVLLADELLAERALAHDQRARTLLVQHVFRPLRAKPPLLETATAYLDHGGSLEATARALIVHVNTVRYRLTAICGLVGYDLTDPHDNFTVRLALAYGALDAAPRTAP